LGLELLRREGSGWKALCVWHHERTPSLSVRLHSDGLGFKCFACGRSGTVLDLLAALNGCDLRGQSFLHILELGENLAGIRKSGPSPALQRARRCTRRTLPPQSELAEVWASCGGVCDDSAVAAWLASRGLLADRVEERDLARALIL